ncbi:MAG: trypsin-like peptidase domain-containing protein [Acidimicrobiales bacterium]
MAFDPLAATGLITVTSSDVTEIVGTCFLFRHEAIALTADHCVPRGDMTIRVHLPRLGRVDVVDEVRRHEYADVAMLILGDGSPTTTGYPENAFWDRVSNWALGEQVMAYGFPSEGPNPGGGVSPIPRLFVAHYQRFFDYESPQGYRYLAGEIGIPAPGGLSGGPVFRQGAPQMLTGLVTANHESYAITDSLEEVREGGDLFRLEARKVISYGVVLMLSGVSGWLQEVVPPRNGMGWVS